MADRYQATTSLPQRVTSTRTYTDPRKYTLDDAMGYRWSMFKAGLGLGFCFVVMVELWLQETHNQPIDYLSLLFAALAGIMVGSVVYMFYGVIVTYLNYQVYEEETVQEIEPTYTVQPARIPTGVGTAVIEQPAGGAFAKWARDVLDDSQARVQFSQNQATERGFDYRHVLGQLRNNGLVAANPDGNGVHRVSDLGKHYLKAWLEAQTPLP